MIRRVRFIRERYAARRFAARNSRCAIHRVQFTTRKLSLKCVCELCY